MDSELLYQKKYRKKCVTILLQKKEMNSGTFVSKKIQEKRLTKLLQKKCANF